MKLKRPLQKLSKSVGEVKFSEGGIRPIKTASQRSKGQILRFTRLHVEIIIPLSMTMMVYKNNIGIDIDIDILYYMPMGYN